MVVRLQKFLADAGVASRRAGEQLIREGRVVVNGQPVTEMGAKVDPSHDHVTVDGRAVREKRKIYLALNKPRGLVCSHKDEHGRPSIYSLLPAEWGHLHSVGRLDFNSEGLIFLTNDGQFSLKLTHPRYGVRKKYVVTASGLVTEAMLKKFETGVRHDGELLKAAKTALVSASDSNSVVEMELTEGKNREVRRMFESQGLMIKRLQRVQIGKIKLGELRPGRWRTLTETEIKTLLS
jgi:23S rRNA pseudouridine2605 synthase